MSFSKTLYPLLGSGSTHWKTLPDMTKKLSSGTFPDVTIQTKQNISYLEACLLQGLKVKLIISCTKT